MKFLAAIFSVVALFGAPTVTILQTSPTQMKALVSDNATPCTFQISESASLTPLHPDVDASHFASANTEAAHIKESWWNGATFNRILLFGKRTAQVSSSTGLRTGRALAGDTVYYFKATCGSGNTTTTFKTASIRGIAPEEPPLDATQFEQLALPEWNDFTQAITDNKGSKLLTQDPNAWGEDRPVYISGKSFTSGGSGWTGSIIPWLGTGATVTNANPLFVALDTWRSDPANSCGPAPDGCPYNDQVDTVSGYWYDDWTDIAVDLNGVATVGTGNLAKIQVALSLDSGQTAFTPYQVATLPTGSAGPVQVPNTTDGAAANYPTAYFKGWGKRIERRYWPKQGYVTVASSVVTLTKAVIGPFGTSEAIGAGPESDNAYFDTTWPAGTKIGILGSSAASSGACANDYCTIVSCADATHCTISEAIASMTGDNFYQSAAFGVIIKRMDASSGSVTFSARMHLAKSWPFNIGFYGGTSLVQATSTDGITGYTALFSGFGNAHSPRLAPGGLFFIGTTGPGAPVVRFLSPFSNGGTCTNGNSDCPVSGHLGPNGAYFSDADPTKIYFAANSQAGKLSLFQASYNAATYGYLPYSNWQPSYGSSNYAPPSTNEISYTNITPGANDLATQIATNVPGFNASVFGTGFNLRATTGPFALLDIGGQNTASWIFIFCITNAGPCATAGAGKFYKAYYTEDSAFYGGTDPAPAGTLRHLGNHATVASFGSSAANGYTFSLATHEQQFGRTDLFQGGPFATIIAAVKRSGVYTPVGVGLGTQLIWPPDSSYDNTCPGGLPADIVTMGAVTPYCAQVQSAMPCNASAGATEISLRPCPYLSMTAGYLGGFQLRDFFKDNSVGISGGGDNEGFKVITTPTPSLYPDFVAFHAYLAGAIIKPLTNNAGNSLGGYYFKVSANCNSGNYPGAWNQTYSGTTTDSGGCVWTNIANLFDFYIQRDANPSYCTITHDSSGGGGGSNARYTHADGWGLTMWPREACAGGTQPVIDIVNDIYVIPNQTMSRGHGGMVTVGSQSVPAGQNPGLFNRIASGSAGGYKFANRRAFADLWKPADGETPQAPSFAGLLGNCCQSYVDAKAPLASESFKQWWVDWAHFDPNGGAELEYPGATLGASTNLTLQAGTTGVYKMTVSTDGTGGGLTIDIKRSPIFTWGATKYFIDVSNPVTASHQITDSTRFVKCYAYKSGECRTTSSAGDFFISIPATWPINYGACTTSQMNVFAPCAFSATNQGGQLRIGFSAYTDDLATKQIYLGWGGAGPEHQQVYSNFLPTPDGLYGFYPMLASSGYHTGLMMIKMPDVSHLDAINRTTFVPVMVSGKSNQNVYVEFGYEEFGSDGITKFYCTSRKENCTAGAATINEANPFQFATTDTTVTTTGTYTIAVPAISQRTLVYHVVTGGSAGPSHWLIVP